MQQYKELILRRERECDNLRALFRKEMKRQASKANFCKSFLIIAGALIATKEVGELLMLKMHFSELIGMVLTIIYTLLGVSISVVAGLDAAYRFASKADRLNYLTVMCQNQNRYFMSDYLAYLNSSPDPAIVEQRIADLVRERNKDLERVLSAASEIGVDTSSVDVHYSIYDIPDFQEPALENTRPSRLHNS